MKKLLSLAVLALLLAAPHKSQASADGVPSTGSFTVNSVGPLSAATATGSITVVTVTGAAGSILNVGSVQLRAGIDFQVGATTATTAASIAAAINNNSLIPVTATYGPGSTVISLQAEDVGSLYNQVRLVSSAPSVITMSGTTLAGGQDNAVLTINYVSLRQGADWFALDTASNTAISIAAAINHAKGLQPLIEAVPLAGVVYLRSTLTPAAYPIATSDATDLAASGATMTGGSAGFLARMTCNLGIVDALPTSNYPAGCTAYLTSDPTHTYLSTQTVVGLQSWLAK